VNSKLIFEWNRFCHRSTYTYLDMAALDEAWKFYVR